MMFTLLSSNTVMTVQTKQNSSVHEHAGPGRQLAMFVDVFSGKGVKKTLGLFQSIASAKSTCIRCVGDCRQTELKTSSSKSDTSCPVPAVNTFGCTKFAIASRTNGE